MLAREGFTDALRGEAADDEVLLVTLALTFDDGPDPRGTPAVLDALEAAGATATFFVLGERVDEHPPLLSRVLDAGHAVEVHGYGHLRHPRVTRKQVEDDIDRALEALDRAGVRPTRWRIPWGHLADFTRPLATARGLRIFGWSIDTHDWRGETAPAMLAELPLEYGGIVLAHDGISVGAQRETARETANLIEPLVATARQHGLTPGPLTADWPVPIPVGNPEFHPGVVEPA